MSSVVSAVEQWSNLVPDFKVWWFLSGARTPVTRKGRVRPVSARQVETHQRALLQAGAPDAAAGGADPGHHRVAAVRPFEVVHACPALVIGGDPGDGRRLRLQAFRQARRQPTEKERQLVQAFERRVRFRGEGDPDDAIVGGAEVVGKAGKLRSISCFFPAPSMIVVSDSFMIKESSPSILTPGGSSCLPMQGIFRRTRARSLASARC